MHNLERNKKTVYYKTYLGETAIVDASGYKTGEYTVNYGVLTSIKAYVSPSRGDSSYDPFGINVDYTNTMLVDDTDCPITESTLLWIDKDPEDGQGNATPHNYIVKRRAPSFNCIAYAIKEVDVS